MLPRKAPFLLTLFLTVLLTLSLSAPAHAQQDEPAPPPIEAAVNAVNQAEPGIGLPQRFTYTFLEPTRDSSLRCPLRQGFQLANPVTPYRIMLLYPDVTYTYHASADASILIPCDEKLPTGGPLPPGEQPYAPTSPIDAVIATFLTDFPQRHFPERYEFTFDVPTTDSSLGCPLVEGSTLEESVIPYRVTLFYEDAQFTYHASEDASILVPCDEKLMQ